MRNKNIFTTKDGEGVQLGARIQYIPRKQMNIFQ